MEYKLITELAYTYIGLVTTMTKHYVDEGVPLIFNSSIKRDGIDTSKPVFLDREFAEKNKNRKHKKDDVVTVHTGDIGVSAIISDDLDGSLGFATIVTRIKDFDVLNPEYLCAFLNYGGGKEQLYKYSRDARNNLNLADYDRLIVPLPGIEKQIEIVNIVNKMKNVIANRKQEVQKLDELIKARFVEMFGDYDLSHTQSDWKPIADIGKVVGGATPKTNIEEYWDGEYRWITPAELDSDNGYIYNSVRKLTKAGVDSCSLQEMPIDTVILSSRAPIGKVAIAGNTFYCNQGFKNIVCNDEIIPRYLYTILLLNTEYLNSLGRGATFKEISKSIVENIRIPVPSIELQKKFADFVEQTDKSKVAVQKALDEAQLLFDSLMQKYFG